MYMAKKNRFVVCWLIFTCKQMRCSIADVRQTHSAVVTFSLQTFPSKIQLRLFGWIKEKSVSKKKKRIHTDVIKSSFLPCLNMHANKTASDALVLVVSYLFTFAFINFTWTQRQANFFPFAFQMPFVCVSYLFFVALAFQLNCAHFQLWVGSFFFYCHLALFVASRNILNVEKLPKQDLSLLQPFASEGNRFLHLCFLCLCANDL